MRNIFLPFVLPLAKGCGNPKPICLCYRYCVISELTCYFQATYRSDVK